MTQLALLPTARPSGGDVTDELVAKQASMHAAILLCMTVSGLNDQQIADQLDLDAGQFSRIKTGNAHFPPNKLVALMDVCGNEVPLRWLAAHRGYELKRRMSALESELASLRAENAELRKEREVVAKFMREIGR